MAELDSQRANLSRLTTAYNSFGFKLLAKLLENDPERNILISSFSIASSLALICNGAGRTTRQSIAQTLDLDEESLGEVNRNNRKLYDDLAALKDKVQLAAASALWAGKGISFDPSFLEVAERFFEAEARSVDFDSAATVDIINAWVQQRTASKINSLIQRDDLSAQTGCMLTNAVYFKGLWTTPFAKELTREGIFHLQHKRKKRIWLMHQLIDHAYFENDTFQAVNLSYGDGEIGSYILLPATQISLGEFLKGIQIETWENWTHEFQERQVELKLPRFRMTYRTELVEPLDELGMSVAFNSGADFSPMGLAGQYITSIKHKAVAEFNEEGTEAAATTAIMVGRSLFTPPRMIVDRPFFWAIRDNKTGLLLFIGVVFNPDN